MIDKVTRNNKNIVFTFDTKQEADEFYFSMKAIADAGLKLSLVGESPTKKPRKQ
jgi:hypothetical protein